MKKFSMFLVLLAFALNFGLVQAWAEDLKQDVVAVSTGEEESFEAIAAKVEEKADKTTEEAKPAEVVKATDAVVLAVTEEDKKEEVVATDLVETTQDEAKA